MTAYHLEGRGYLHITFYYEKAYMKISRIILKNWRNFQLVDVPLEERIFLIGANASGKSNFLDAFRFLHDIAKTGGGLQRTVTERGGLSSIRCFTAPKSSIVELEVHLTDSSDNTPRFKYAIGIKPGHPVTLAYERVFQSNQQLINRPDKEDKQDVLRLTQTYLEQMSMNAHFREIAYFFDSVFYLHLVPQLFRFPENVLNQGLSENPFGRTFLKQLSNTPEKIRQSRLKQIEQGLRITIPQFKRLIYSEDEKDMPHLEAVYEPWEQVSLRENQFSDGTLRLIGLFWALLESDTLLLLEEPELSLNGRIVNELAPLIYRLQHPKQGQVILSTQSGALLSDKGIAGEEVLLLTPSEKGTQVELASSIEPVRHLLEAGLSIADAALSRTNPPALHEQSLFQ
jgi:predicted ATPase